MTAQTLNQFNTTSFNSLPSQYQIIKAYGPLLDSVYSVRYQSYSAENYIEKCATKRFMDEYDGAPNCESYLMYSHKKLVGSIRSCVYKPEGKEIIPVMEVFEDELRKNIGYDKTIIEANKFVIHPDFQRKGGILARFTLYKTILESAINNNADCVVVAVRPAHVKFYKMFCLQPISDAKSYPHLSFETVLMACTDIESAREFIWNKIEEKAA